MDVELDQAIRLYKLLQPESGLQYTTGFLCNHGLKIQHTHVRESLECIDGLGCALCHHETILCHKYKSSHSGAVFHIDGHHKLITCNPWDN